MAHCEMVAKGIVREKGYPSIEFYRNGEPQYYCMGWENKMTDEPYEECMRCPKFVSGEQLEKDFEEAKALGQLGR